MTVGEDFENAIIDVNNSVIKPTQSDALRLYGLFKLVK